MTKKFERFVKAIHSPFSDIKSTQTYLGESKDDMSFKTKFSLFTLTSDMKSTFFAAMDSPFNLNSDKKRTQSYLGESKDE